LSNVVGFKFLKPLGKMNLNAYSIYKMTTNGFEGNNYGNVSIQSLSVSYLINKTSETDSLSIKETKSQWILEGGYYGESIEMAVENGVRDMNSGYYLGMAFTGISFKHKTWTIPFNFSLPLFQTINGEQNAASFRFKIGLSKVF
jgi:hypothetical protein